MSDTAAVGGTMGTMDSRDDAFREHQLNLTPIDQEVDALVRRLIDSLVREDEAGFSAVLGEFVAYAQRPSVLKVYEVILAGLHMAVIEYFDDDDVVEDEVEYVADWSVDLATPLYPLPLDAGQRAFEVLANSARIKASHDSVLDDLNPLDAFVVTGSLLAVLLMLPSEGDVVEDGQAVLRANPNSYWKEDPDWRGRLDHALWLAGYDTGITFG